MPTYHSPSSSPSHSPSRSSSTSRRNRNRSRQSRNRTRTPSSSRSRSRSRSWSRSRSGSPSTSNKVKSKLKGDDISDTKKESIVKTSLIFLGAIGAATAAAHKFWPKGVTYGEKEEWECKQEKKAKRALREEAREAREAAGDGRRGRHAAAGAAAAGGAYAASETSSGGSGRADREERRARYREVAAGGRPDDRNGGGRALGPARGGEDYYAREEVIVRDRETDLGRSRSRIRERSRSRERDVAYVAKGRERDDVYVSREESDRYRGPSGRGDRDRDRERDRYEPSGLPPPAVVERHASTRREVNYYPPAPQRFQVSVDRGGVSTAATVGSGRRSSVDRSSRPTRYYEDGAGLGPEPEVVYVRREPAPSGGRYSIQGATVVDVGRPRSRYDNDY